eukprot:s1840_g2.t1
MVKQKNPSPPPTRLTCQVQQAQPFWRQNSATGVALETATGVEQWDAHRIMGRLRAWVSISSIPHSS